MSDAIRLVTSFVIAVAIASAAATLYAVATVDIQQNTGYSSEWLLYAWGFGLFALVFGAPFILVACIVLLLIRTHISGHFRSWSVLALLIVVAVYVATDFVLLNKINRPFVDYILAGPVVYRAAAAFGVAALTAMIFYCWNRPGSTRPGPSSHLEA